MTEIPKYDKIERFKVGDVGPSIEEQMKAQIKACEQLYLLPKRDLALHASLSTKPQSRQELLANADVIYSWLNQN